MKITERKDERKQYWRAQILELNWDAGSENLNEHLAYVHPLRSNAKELHDPPSRMVLIIRGRRKLCICEHLANASRTVFPCVQLSLYAILLVYMSVKINSFNTRTKRLARNNIRIYGAWVRIVNYVIVRWSTAMQRAEVGKPKVSVIFTYYANPSTCHVSLEVRRKTKTIKDKEWKKGNNAYDLPHMIDPALLYR